jgi:hypothetical protein
MRKIIGAISVIVAAASLINAEELVQKKVYYNAEEQSAKKVYYDSENKKVYWPLEKPFFLKLSESQDTNSVAYPLNCRAGRGFQVQTSGSHFFRWINMFKSDTSYIAFYADGERPKCTTKFDSAQKYYNINKWFFGRGLKIDFTATDRYSGIDKIMAGLDSNTCVPVTGTLSIDNEKEYVLNYYAIDNVGNIGESQSVQFGVDLTAPVISVSSGNAPFTDNSILSKTQVITLSALDKLSGVKTIFYKFNQTDKLNVTKGNVSLYGLQDGEHTITFFSVDNVGNQENPRTMAFSIDNTPPVAVTSFEGDLYSPKAGVVFVSPKTLVKIDATDNKSGVARVEYLLSEKFVTYTTPFNLPPQDGRFIINSRVVDKNNNVSTINKSVVTMDTKAPRSKLEITGPMWKNGIFYITSASRIVLSSEDLLSGVKEVRYSIDNGAITPYSMPLSFEKEGKFVLKYGSIDNVNNAEEPQNINVVVDNTPPKIVETFSVTTNVGTDIQATIRVPRSTTLILAATDNSSGVQGIWYSMNGKKSIKCEGALFFDKKGVYALAVKCVDNVGNTVEKNLNIEVTE